MIAAQSSPAPVLRRHTACGYTGRMSDRVHPEDFPITFPCTECRTEEFRQLAAETAA